MDSGEALEESFKGKKVENCVVCMEKSLFMASKLFFGICRILKLIQDIPVEVMVFVQFMIFMLSICS